MKTTTLACATGLLATAALTSWASDLDQQQLARCQAELENHYGRSAEVRLVDRQRFQDGLRLKVAVRRGSPETGNYAVQFANCWVDNATDDLADSRGDAAIAATDGDPGR